MNGGSCLDSPSSSSFHCACPLPFTASLCEIELPSICSLQNPCKNNAKCVLTTSLQHYKCECFNGWTGIKCDQIDYCSHHSCQHGKCVNHNNGYECVCEHGYEGQHCNDDINECINNDCNGHGQCINTIGSFKCVCQNGWTGKECESQYVACESSNPCLNGGKCNVKGDNQYECECVNGWGGRDCHINIDDCGGHLCQNNAQCIDGINTYTCQCQPGFTGTFNNHFL